MDIETEIDTDVEIDVNTDISKPCPDLVFTDPLSTSPTSSSHPHLLLLFLALDFPPPYMFFSTLV